MRIDVVNRVYSTYQTQAAATSKKIDKVSSRDEVALSSEAKNFASIKKMIEDGSKIRSEKVNEIKNTYQAQSIAASKQMERINSKNDVALSSEAKDVDSVKKMLEDSPEIRSEKVDEIKQRIANNTYNVSSYDVAEKMLQFSTRG